MRVIDALTLGAVALVVLLVSLPRLADMAVRENEADALWLTRRLAEAARQAPEDTASIESLLAAEPALVRLLDDAEFLEGGRLLRRHGYLFEVLAPLPGGSGECSPEAVRAWPWQHPRTGRQAFAWTCQGSVMAHANAQGTWSGLGQPPPAAAGHAGWHQAGRP